MEIKFTFGKFLDDVKLGNSSGTVANMRSVADIMEEILVPASKRFKDSFGGFSQSLEFEIEPNRPGTGGGIHVITRLIIDDELTVEGVTDIKREDMESVEESLSTFILSTTELVTGQLLKKRSDSRKQEKT